MITETGTATKSPPYLAYATFKNFLASIGQGVIPKVINKHLMVGQSGSNQTYLLSALRFFDLIDENGVPRADLEKLVKAKDDERKKIWKRVFETAYSTILHELDLEKATAGLLNQRFADAGLNGATLRKCHAFLMSAAEDAGIPLAPGLKPTRGAKVGRPRKARGAARQPDGGADDFSPSQPKTMQELLLAKFPEFDPGWSDELKSKWFEGYDRLLKSATGA